MILSNEFLSNEVKYKKYLDEHLACITKVYNEYENTIALEITGEIIGGEKRKNNTFSTCMIRKSLKQRIPRHDATKFSKKEFIPYCNDFCSNSKDEPIEEEFQKAREHHYAHNDHHPEFWIYEVDDKKVSIPMRDDAFAEMIIDWIAEAMMENSNTLEWWNNKGKTEKGKYLDSSDIRFLDNFFNRYSNNFDFSNR